MTRSQALKIRANIESAVQSLSNPTAVEMVTFYPAWAAGVVYTAGVKMRYNGRLYEAIQPHTSQADWTPDIVASLYTEINEMNVGTSEDPIPYGGNMALVSGKYYSQNGVVYLCNRDTVNPVYADLSALIGLYVSQQ